MTTNICLVGFQDKRAVIYTALLIFSKMGSTALISPSPSYRLMDNERREEFSSLGIDYFLRNEGVLDAEEDIDKSLYSYIIYDCVDELPSEVDFILVCDTQDYFKSLLVEGSFTIIDRPFIESNISVIDKMEESGSIIPLKVSNTLIKTLSTITGIKKGGVETMLKKGVLT